MKKGGDRLPTRRAVAVAAAAGIAAAAGLILLAGPLIAILFEGGSFGPADSVAVAGAIALVAPAIPAKIVLSLVQRIGLARDRRRLLVGTAVGSALTVLLAMIGAQLIAGAPVAGWTIGWLAVGAGAWIIAQRLQVGPEPVHTGGQG